MEAQSCYNIDDSAKEKPQVNYNDAEFIANPKLTGLNYRKKYGKSAPYFRTEFSVDRKIARATLYASSLGVFKAYLNGKEVEDDRMSPGYTDYRRRIPYETYDVTSLMQERNALGFVCGDGWAVGYMGNYMFRCNYAEAVHLWAKLIVVFADGSERHINTSSAWKTTHRGEIVRTDNYMGEVIDHRRLSKDFAVFGYDDSAWDNACTTNHSNAAVHLLDPAIAPRARVKQELEGVQLNYQSNIAIYDFRQNFSGVIRLICRGKRGSRLVVRHGEWLNADGTVYTDNLRKAEATDTMILSGKGEEEFCPLFTFHGFRFAEVRIEGQAEIISVKGLAIYSDLESTGKFICSDEQVNRLYQNIVWGQRSNFLSIPTDCPQRDERLGWMGDAQIFCGTAMYNMDCRRFFKKYIYDILDAQLGNGSVPSIVPQIPHKDSSIEMGWWTPAGGWSEAIVIIPYEYYVMYGDTELLKACLPGAKRYINFLTDTSGGLIRPSEQQYGDWLAVGEQSDNSVIATFYFAYAAKILAEICRILNDSDEERYQKVYRDVCKSFRAKFVASDGRILSDTQSCYLLAFQTGILDASTAKRHLLEALSRSEMHLTTGFLGVKFLLPVLCELGEPGLAYGLLTRNDYPSWLHSVANGATTVWERWNSYTADGGFADKTMNSFNHYSLGSCGEWMFRYCLGIGSDTESDGAGFRRIIFRPFPDPSGKLESASGEYRSASGPIRASWKRSGGGFLYRAEYPQGATAAFDFSHFAVAEERAPGTYYLEYGDGR